MTYVRNNQGERCSKANIVNAVSPIQWNALYRNIEMRKPRKHIDAGKTGICRGIWLPYPAVFEYPPHNLPTQPHQLQHTTYFLSGKPIKCHLLEAQIRSGDVFGAKNHLEKQTNHSFILCECVGGSRAEVT